MLQDPRSGAHSLFESQRRAQALASLRPAGLRMPPAAALTVHRIVHDERADRFVILVDGAQAGFTQYTATAERRTFFHTEIAPDFQGQGLATELISAALTSTRDSGMRIVPVCPFVRHYLRTHHDFDDDIDRVLVNPGQAQADA